MHLLTETAMSDSRDFEVLSFQELEDLKRQRRHLRNRIETTKRKIALESKLRDAAQSLNRLYAARDKTDPSAGSPKRTRRSILGHKSDGSGGGAEALHRADDAYAASSKKVEEFTQELAQQEEQLHHTETRLLEHTAGILQLTHKGLKKNIRRPELPRSPESMTSQPNGRSSGLDGMDDFDERSLYQVPDYVTNSGPPMMHGLNTSRASNRDTQALGDVAIRLQELNSRLHVMITHAGSQAHFDPPPRLTDEDMMGRIGAQIQAHLGYLSQGLEAMEAVQARTGAAGQESLLGHEDQLEYVNMRLQDMLERTNSVSHSPLLQQDEPRGKDLQSQLAFSSVVLDRLNQRVETLVEQKDILSRQIQQQRELNSKSDAERDARIHELMDEVEQSKRLQVVGEEEAQHSRDHINLLMEQLDLAKQESTLLESQRGASDSQAVASERTARKEIEGKLMADLQAQQEEHGRLHSDMIQLRQDSESKAQQLLGQLEQLRGAKDQADADLEQVRGQLAQLGVDLAQAQTERDEVSAMLRKHIGELESAKTAAESELSRVREEMQELETEVVRAQTELTMVKAELDGAYGTRAQRAADVSMNPAIQKEIDDLNERNTQLQSQLDLLKTQHETKGVGSAELQNKVNTLQQELKEVIEEYEIMTKHSIDDEKERDRLEELIDALQERCEALESQLSEEKVKWLGAKVGSPVETTSTMVLKNEFKKMMRETRTENLKALKVRNPHCWP
jgi:chromosome segregation ATPase